MRLGIFAKTFVRSTLAETLDAVVAAGFESVQMNLSVAGLPTVPRALDLETAREIGAELAARRLRVEAISGTFNLIDPDLRRREMGLAGLRVLGAACEAIGTDLITLCSGTRDPEDMWTSHPENQGADAWRDLRAALDRALATAEEFDLRLGIEPEAANVVSDAARARRLLDEVRSPRLQIVMDPANLPAHESLDHAFELLGPDLALAHGKNLRSFDRERYLRLLESCGFDGSIVLHGLSEEEVPEARALVMAHA